MKKILFLMSLALCSYKSFSQKILTSWSQQNIENYTKEMYDKAQALTSSELLLKNINDKTWGAVFLTLNASVNNYSKDRLYLEGLAKQISNSQETKLEGTSRLVIWDRIINQDIIFEGKGLVVDNDLFKIGGRANQILQNLTNKNFGFITVSSNEKELGELESKWLAYLSDKPVEQYKAIEYKNAKIQEISSLIAIHALVISLQDNLKKQQITKNCLKKVYNLDEMPKDKSSSALYCNPDTYSFAYLGMLFGDAKFDESKDAKWWQDFWDANHNKFIWNSDKGNFEVKK